MAQDVQGAVALEGCNERLSAFPQDGLDKLITVAASGITARMAAEQPSS